jgi:hypothetical protein
MTFNFHLQKTNHCHQGRHFRERKSWRGLLMDGTHQDPSIGLKRELIYPTNIVDLFEKYSVPKRSKTVNGKVVEKMKGEVRAGNGGDTNSNTNNGGPGGKSEDKGESKGILGKLGDIFKTGRSNASVKVDTNSAANGSGSANASGSGEASTKLSEESLSALNGGDFEFMGTLILNQILRGIIMSMVI